MTVDRELGVYEFFAGGGMARAGLEPGWRTLFANDFDPMKGRAYAENWGADGLVVGDVNDLTPEDLPGRATLAWASSPCQDLSLAGRRGGLSGARSSAFFGFWRLMQALDAQGRAPPVVVIENVTGLFTSNGGADFAVLCEVLSDAGYVYGAVELDAADFAAQSRPRMFMIASRREAPGQADAAPSDHVHSRRLRAAYDRLAPALQSGWRWWRLPPPPLHNSRLADLLEPDDAVPWRSPAETDRLVAQLAPLQTLRLAQIAARTAKTAGERAVGALFRRTRTTAEGRVQRAEVRFDGRAGCLRTSGGGSSRQFLLVVEAGQVRSRHMTAREAARLMGLPDSYRLPPTTTAALHLVGDGVAVPVVRWLSEHLLRPLADETAADRRPRLSFKPIQTPIRKVFP
jgi:DNA (cytosine-5)-methyltransferase 1